MIKFDNVTKSYNGKTNAVEKLNLTIDSGKVFGFLGHNGAGKTTTIKMLTGITDITSGNIEINGVSIERDPIKAKKMFGYVPDSPDMFLRLKGIQYINFMANVYKVPKDLREKRISEFAKRFEMQSALGDTISSYSHGMRQKIVIMGALIHDPDVWILDEPMTGLDPKASFELKQMMREHADKGKTVLFSTHVLEVAEKICDQIAIVNKGNVMAYGTIDEIKAKHGKEKSFEKIFLEMTAHE